MGYPLFRGLAFPEEAVEALRALLRETVRQHLISDVPLGVFLSGGLDSSTLVALMRDLGVDPLRTFSIGYPTLPSANCPMPRWWPNVLKPTTRY